MAFNSEKFSKIALNFQIFCNYFHNFVEILIKIAKTPPKGNVLAYRFWYCSNSSYFD